MARAVRPTPPRIVQFRNDPRWARRAGTLGTMAPSSDPLHDRKSASRRALKHGGDVFLRALQKAAIRCGAGVNRALRSRVELVRERTKRTRFQIERAGFMAQESDQDLAGGPSWWREGHARDLTYWWEAAQPCPPPCSVRCG